MADPSHAETVHDEAAHASVRTYVLIFVILFIVTALEVATYFIPWFRNHYWVLFWVLSILSIAKFALVVGFYMHLRYDATFFNRVFVVPLVAAVAMTVVLMVLTAGKLIA